MNADVKAYIFRTVRRLINLAVLYAVIWFVGLPLSHYLMNGQHPILDGIRQHFVDHLAEYLSFIGVLSIAFVCTWPPLIPRTAQEWWTWFRDAFQTAIPASRARSEQHSQSTVSTPNSTTVQEATASKSNDPPNPLAPPVDPAQPK